MAAVGQDSKRSEVGELRALMRNPEVQRDPRRYLQAVQKVIACMTLGIDVSKLFSEMIMAGATQDVVQKKLVYLYLGNYSQSNSDLALLTINTLQKDCKDRNPMVRGLALRSMCSLRLPNILEYLRDPLQAGLGDRSAYVRKTAIMGIVKLFYVVPQFISEMNFVDILYQMLRDRDAQVVSNCIAALSEILASEGGMVINTKIAHYLLNRLKDFSEWGQCQILELLRSYQPASEEEVFDLLNILDDRLKHANCGVVLSAVCLFIKLTEDMPHVQEDVYSRIKTPLLTFLGSSSAEQLYTCLQHVQLLLARQPQLWSEDSQIFFCRYNDPPYVKMKKLELLTEVCALANAKGVVDELGEYATDVNSLVARHAIQAVGRIALRLPARANICIDKLLSLLTMEIDYVTSETLVVMTNILRKFDNMVEIILPQLPSDFDSISDPEGRAALLWILGEHGESLPNTPYMLEEVVNGVSEEASAEVKLELLSAVMKMFFKRPPECQEMLGRLLEHAIDEEGDIDVHDRGMLYYRLLKKDVKEAQRVVSGQAKTVAEKNTVIPRLSLFPEFNTLSVMYGELSSNFITQEPPYIRGETQSTRNPETNFDNLMETLSVGSSDSSGSSPAIRLRDDISVHTPIEIPDPPIPNSPPCILLNPKAAISAGDFEAKWLALEVMREGEVKLDYVPPPREMEKALAARFIMTMASSPPNQQSIKMFLYAQHVSTLHYFLMEVNLSLSELTLSLSLKCEKRKQANFFIRHFLETLATKNVLSKP